MEVGKMNKARLYLKLKKMLPTDEVEFVYKSIISSKHFDKIIDVEEVDNEIRCIVTDATPKDGLKRAALNYFDSKLPADVATYTQLDKLAGRVKREFDMIAMEALAEMIKDFEE